MQKTRLSEHLRQYYEEKQPSEREMDRLLAMAKQPSSEASSRNSLTAGIASLIKWFRRAWQGPARPALLVSLLALGLLISTTMIKDSDNVTQRVAREIALNHNKQLMVEFTGDTYAALSQQMSKLDFIVKPSVRMASSHYQMLGGRYCSIQGHLAAQLKFQDKQGGIHTLYQTLKTGTLTNLEVGRVQQQGLDITLWHEAGLLYGLASPISTAQTF